jgi:hypothetical protein
MIANPPTSQIWKKKKKKPLIDIDASPICKKFCTFCDIVNGGDTLYEGNHVWTTSAHFTKWSAYRGGCFAFPNGHATLFCGGPLLVGYQSIK